MSARCRLYSRALSEVPAVDAKENEADRGAAPLCRPHHKDQLPPAPLDTMRDSSLEPALTTCSPSSSAMRSADSTSSSCSRGRSQGGRSAKESTTRRPLRNSPWLWAAPSSRTRFVARRTPVSALSSHPGVSAGHAPAHGPVETAGRNRLCKCHKALHSSHAP